MVYKCIARLLWITKYYTLQLRERNSFQVEYTNRRFSFVAHWKHAFTNNSKPATRLDQQTVTTAISATITAITAVIIKIIIIITATAVTTTITFNSNSHSHSHINHLNARTIQVCISAECNAVDDAMPTNL